MVQLIVGKKGKGKTKQLLDKVNAEVKTANGNIVYIDKSTKHMFELNNKVLPYGIPVQIICSLRDRKDLPHGWKKAAF